MRIYAKVEILVKFHHIFLNLSFRNLFQMLEVTWYLFTMNSNMIYIIFHTNIVTC